MARQFERVSCRYGAPMGRFSVGNLDTSPRSVRLFRVRLDNGGYDDGGAYWGLRPIGQSLWCAIDRDGNMQFTDARSRFGAALALEIPVPALIVEPKGWRSDLAMMMVAGIVSMEDAKGYMRECNAVELEGAAVGRGQA